MKKISLVLACLISILVLSGCKNPLSESNHSRIDDNFDNDESFPVSTFGVILPLENVNMVNASSYAISGVCNPHAGNVVVSMGVPTVVASFSCYQHGQNNGYFSGTLNLLGITSGTLDISISQGSMVAVVLPADSPSVDLAPIASAPSIADQSFVSGTIWDTHITCSEVGEIVVFNGAGLIAGIQSHTCHSAGVAEPITLQFSPGTSTSDPNPIFVNSVDANGNPSLATTSFSLPIDNVAPLISITNGGTVYESEVATFTISILEDHFTGSYEVTSTSGVINVVNGGTGTTCNATICDVEVTSPDVGLLILSVEAGEVEDLAGNTNTGRVNSRLNILDDLNPVALSLSLSSTDGDSDGWYETGDTVSLSLVFDEPVFVNTAGGTPYLPLALNSGTKQATYVSGSGTDTLVFEFAIVASDTDCDGVITVASIIHDGGMIVDSYNQSPDYSILPTTVFSVYVDTVVPQAPTVLTLSGTAMNGRTPNLSWTPAHDSCGIAQVMWAVGTTSGDDDVQAFMGIGNVNSYQGYNGVDGASFNLQPETDYYISLKVVDFAGHESIVATSTAWNFSCISPMTSLSRLVDLDSSDESMVIDENGIAADNVAFTGAVRTWLDTTANMYDLLALDTSLVYSPDTHAGGFVTKDSYVDGDGTAAMSVDIVPYSGDFVFAFVAQATDAGVPEYSSLFSSSDDENTVGSWQLDKGGPLSGCEDRFRIYVNDQNVQEVLCGPLFNTAPHLFMVKYSAVNKTMSFIVDNVEYDSKLWVDAPTFESLRLLENRTSNGRQPARVHQATLLDEYLNPSQEASLSEFLSCKWNLGL